MADKYWWPSGGTGSSTGNWDSTTNWSSSSTSYAATTAPTISDNANFGSYSGASAFTVTIATASVCSSLTIANSKMTLAGSSTLGIAGSVNVSSFSGRSYSGTITFGTSLPSTINFGSMTLNSLLIFSGSGTRTLTGNISTAGQITHTGGTITAGAYNVQALSYTSTTGTRTLNMGSGTWTLIGVGTTWSVTGSLALNSETSTIKISGSGPTTFAGGSKTYYNLVLNNSYAKTISGSNTFNNISNLTNPTTLTLTAGTTQTVSNFNLNGTAGNIVTINSTVAGSPATISKTSGIVSCDYLSIKDNTATGGASWYAGANSTNVSGNTGWIFTAPPVYKNNNFLAFF